MPNYNEKISLFSSNRKRRSSNHHEEQNDASCAKQAAYSSKWLATRTPPRDRYTDERRHNQLSRKNWEETYINFRENRSDSDKVIYHLISKLEEPGIVIEQLNEIQFQYNRSFAFNFQGGFKNNFKFCEIAAFITCQSCA
jgi:hypothetical protein